MLAHTKKQMMPLAKQLESEFLDLYGPVMSGKELQKSLGYVSDEAFRQGIVRGTVMVPIFSIPHRRGKFALTREVAQFLAERRFNEKRKKSGGCDMSDP